jgi:ornithine carbamoyltransferase
MRHLLSIADLAHSDVAALVSRGQLLARSRDFVQTLAGKLVGIYFRNTSTRTRLSFTSAALRLGASVVPIGPQDLQTNTGECLSDTARVISCYLDALVVRTAADDMEQSVLASQNRMAVINAMSRHEHPTQALADLITMAEHFGGLEGVKVLYLGEGNNTAAALALALSCIPGAQLTLLTPPGYGLEQSILDRASTLATVSGAIVRQSHDPDAAPAHTDVVYTTRWQTTGTAKADPNWRAVFRPFSVTARLMEQVSAERTIFLHDLPAVRGEDVDAAVLEGPQSLAFRQAQNKQYAAMAVLEWCLLSEFGALVGGAEAELATAIQGIGAAGATAGAQEAPESAEVLAKNERGRFG